MFQENLKNAGARLGVESTHMRSLTNLVGDLSVPTEQVLTTLRIVASRAGAAELADWAAKELEGYGEDDALPAHRHWPLTITATLGNPLIGVVQNAHVGDLAIGEEYREKVTIHHCRDGIGRVEDVLTASKATGLAAIEHRNLAQIINQGPLVGEGWTCTHASASFSTVRLKNIVDLSRQTALKFCLECEAKGLDLQYEESSDPAPPQERKAWVEQLKTETARSTIRAAWEVARALIFQRARGVASGT